MNIPHVVSMAAREAGISTYEARAALTAAAPYIQAAALREAADDSRMGPVPYGWNASGVASWLCARADQLEVETK